MRQGNVVNFTRQLLAGIYANFIPVARAILDEPTLSSGLMLQRFDLHHRARAAGIHLLLSVAAAVLAAGLVFGLWYPGIYRILAGGRELFLLIVTVDVILGPMLTFAVFNPKKSWPSLRRDLVIIGSIQLVALFYGLVTVYAARPIAMVFEVDRFRVVTAAQVHLADMPDARPEYRRLPLTGPWILGTRRPQEGREHTEALFMALEKGIDRGHRPLFWQPYSESLSDVMLRSRPVELLLAKYPETAKELNEKLSEIGLDETQAKFLPVMARGGNWVAILDRQGQIVHFVQADGFF